MDSIGVFAKDRLAGIASEVERRAKARRDYVVERASLRLIANERDEGTAPLSLSLPGQAADIPPQEFRAESLSQLSETLDVPMKYVNRLLDKGHNDLAAHDLSTLMAREPKRHLIRLLDGQVDAFLSDRYRCLGNDDLLAIALQETQRAGAEVWDLRLTRNEFRFLAVAPHISGQVSLDRTFDPGDGWKSRWYGKDGDTLNAAITISNSETGHGGLRARPSILRRVCANFCVWADGVAQVHIGRRMEDDGELFYSDETRKRSDELIWLKVRDCIATTFNPVAFARVLDQINATTKVQVGKPIEAVEAVVRWGLPLEYKEAILQSFLGGNDITQYGLVQAVTAQANPAHGGLEDGLRSQFEDVGGKLLGMDERTFTRLVMAEA